MKKQDKKKFPDGKNYIKLLPAAAVIAAVTVFRVKPGYLRKYSQKVQMSKMQRNYRDYLRLPIPMMTFLMELLHQKQPALLPKRPRKAGSRREQPKHFLMSRKKHQLQDREAPLHRLHLFRQADTKTEPIREVEPDLVGRSLFR